MRKSDILNKCRRTLFVAVVGSFSPHSSVYKNVTYTNRQMFHSLLFPQCTVSPLCIMHRHRKLFTTKEAMVCYHLPTKKEMLRITAADTALT